MLGGKKIPLWLTRECCRFYEPTVLRVDRDSAAKLLEEMLTETLRDLIGTDGQMLRVEYQTRISDGLIRVTAVAECLEEIGREVQVH